MIINAKVSLRLIIMTTPSALKSNGFVGFTMKGCTMHTPKQTEPLGKKIILPKLRFWWLRIRFAFNNHYTVDTDSPTWKEELDNIIELEDKDA
jgi:hypothetical protein